jgi:AmmeMemoRadiSam system protein B
LLLPQVAIEHRLNAREFFEATLRKAGISILSQYGVEPESYVELFVFEAEVLREPQREAKKIVRHPAVAGMFYPADSEQLHRQIAALMNRVRAKKPSGRIRGLVSPHAGYMYSGLTAAHGYALLRGEHFDTVVVVSPSHREFFSGVSVYPGDAYETPLGRIEVNARLRDALIARAEFVVASERGHRAEHALEVQLPFLQEVLPPFTLVPLVIGDQQRDICIALGEALARVLKEENALLVASTDLSHFYNAKIADALDKVMINDVREFNPDQLMRDLERQVTEACGGGPVVAVMTALRRLGVDNIEVLHHSNSGDVTGDRSSVVGYLSAVAYS